MIPGLTEIAVACMQAAAVDDLVRKPEGWVHLVPIAGLDEKPFYGKCVLELVRKGLLEQVGQRDEDGNAVRVRLSGYGRRELRRRQAAEGGR